jgi:type IV secretory system conjugative DNA transfer VirD4/TraG family protein
MEPQLEIQVRGEINLGNELLLELQDVVQERTGEDRPGKVGSTLGPTGRRHSEIPTKDVEYVAQTYALQEGEGALSIKDRGLALQYGILGKPGSGKTHLLMHLLRQIVAHKRGDPDRKFGGLILDPKAALIDDVRETFRKARREDDLVVVNTRELLGSGINVIDCMLSPEDLGETLVLAARSAGLGSGEPFWLQQMSTVFGAILTLMNIMAPRTPPTLSALMEHAVGVVDGKPALECFLGDVEKEVKRRQVGKQTAIEYQTAVDALRHHTGGEPRNRAIVEQFMHQAFGLFRAPDYACYSWEARGSRTLYDLIIDEGKTVLVSMGPQEVKLTSLLPALMKLIFQRTVISRFERYRKCELHNAERPLLFMADEYHTVATKVEGKFGDSEFFSLGRQFGALCFVATQSVQQLMVSSIEKAWKAVFDVLSAVIVMSGDDPETAKYVDERAGKKTVIMKKRSPSYNDGKESISVSYERLELPVIPVGTFQMLTQGQAIVIGKTEGPQQMGSVRYLRVPPRPED